MDDIQFILYILAAVAYFLFMQWRKAFQTPSEQEEEEQPQRRRPQQPQQPQRPVTSFEDILRELQPKAEKARAEFETAKEKVKETVLPVIIAEEAAPKYKNYDQMPPKALSWEKKLEAKEAQKRAQERRQPVFKAYAQEQHVPESRYARMLRNPATVKDAFILSEIFRRKYN